MSGTEDMLKSFHCQYFEFTLCSAPPLEISTLALSSWSPDHFFPVVRSCQHQGSPTSLITIFNQIAHHCWLLTMLITHVQIYPQFIPPQSWRQGPPPCLLRASHSPPDPPWARRDGFDMLLLFPILRMRVTMIIATVTRRRMIFANADVRHLAAKWIFLLLFMITMMMMRMKMAIMPPMPQQSKEE